MMKFDSNRPIDIICMGRVAVDLYGEQIGAKLHAVNSFKKYLGGCAGNIAVGTSRLNLNSMMFSCVGQDEMGIFIRKTLEQEKVKTDLLYDTPSHLTGLVLLGVCPPDHFPLMFYRENCADMQLTPAHIKAEILAQSKALLITGTGLSQGGMRETTHQAVQIAKNSQTCVILDLDYRPVLWGLTNKGNGEERYLACDEITKIYQSILPHCDLIVGTEEEFCLASGESRTDEAIAQLKSVTLATLVLKTGAQGCKIYCRDNEEIITGKPFKVEVLNVLGAGDGFLSGLLSGLLRGYSWEDSATLANACGALVVTRHGCAPAIPSWEELLFFIQEYHFSPEIWRSERLQALHDRTTAKALESILIKNTSQESINPLVANHPSKINLTSIKLMPDEIYQFDTALEFAALLLVGKVEFEFNGEIHTSLRTDYFSQAPIVLHCPKGTKAKVKAVTVCEILLMETENNTPFIAQLFTKESMLEMDHRGHGLLENTAYRQVRTVFDKRNRPESNLVVGEIISFQGRWSSSPSHYHPQAEIYHYRFSEPQGYAFGESGEDVYKLRHGDTYCIPANACHAHCVAPGYALYTLWIIRHDEANPYFQPIFKKEHEWTRSAEANLRAYRSLNEE